MNRLMLLGAACARLLVCCLLGCLLASPLSCGVGSDSVCHDPHNPCGTGLVCEAGSCIERCDVKPGFVCAQYFGCDRTTGLCAALCDANRFYPGNCPQGQVCSGDICRKY